MKKIWHLLTIAAVALISITVLSGCSSVANQDVLKVDQKISKLLGELKLILVFSVWRIFERESLKGLKSILPRQ